MTYVTFICGLYKIFLFWTEIFYIPTEISYKLVCKKFLSKIKTINLKIISVLIYRQIDWEKMTKNRIEVLEFKRY
jgi:hypothetical protein